MLKDGLYTALVTPFLDSEIDYESFEKLLAFQIESGVSGVVVLGTTGEASCVTLDERKKLVEMAVNICSGAVCVVVGCSSNSTARTLELTLLAQAAGADAVLVVAPYYNKPSQEGIYSHYKYISEFSNIPIIIYNNPGRTVVDINDETIAMLAKLGNIVALKDSSGDISRQIHLNNLLDGDDLIQFCGDDLNAVPFNACFGRGLISVSSNVFAKKCQEIQKLSLGGNFKEAAALQNDLVSFHKLMFSEPSPAAIKYAAYVMDLINSYEVRLPLISSSRQLQCRILEFLNVQGYA